MTYLDQSLYGYSKGPIILIHSSICEAASQFFFISKCGFHSLSILTLFFTPLGLGHVMSLIYNLSSASLFRAVCKRQVTLLHTHSNIFSNKLVYCTSSRSESVHPETCSLCFIKYV